MFEMPAPSCLNWVSPVRKEGEDRNEGLNVGEHRCHLGTGMGEGDQPWDFFGKNDAKAETPVVWPPHAKS